MVTTALFLTAIVLAGIAIAVIADNLGRKLGKKRLHFRGLRPRHVATISTGFVGALVSILTIGLVSLASQDVRKWIVEGQQAIQDVERLRAQERTLNERVEGLDTRVLDLNKTIERKTNEERLATAKLKAETLRLAEMRTRLAAATSRSQRLQAQASRLTGNLSRLQRDVRRQGSQLAGAQRDLKTTQAGAKRAAAALKQAQSDYLDLVANRDSLDKELVKLEANVSAQTAEVARLSGEKDTLSKDFAAAQARYELARLAYEKDLDGLRGDLLSAQNELKQQRDLLGEVGRILQQNRDTSRLSPMIFRYREELARVPIDASRTVAEARKLLEDLLLRSRQLARTRGARQDDSPAGLYDIADANGGVLKTAADQEEELARTMAGKNEPLVVIARSRVNAFAGEFVSLEIGVFRNPLIYRAGQTIAETRVDGRLSEQAILKQVDDFLQSQIRAAVRRDGMIPLQGEEESFGTISPQTVIDLVKELKSASRVVRLLVKARVATRAADQLNLLFEYK